MDNFLSPPPFSPAEALVLLKRSLRDLRALTERGSTFEWKGLTVIDLQHDEHAIHARLARRPARTPEWRAHVLKGSPDVRRFLDEVKRQLQRWDSDD